MIAPMSARSPRVRPLRPAPRLSGPLGPAPRVPVSRADALELTGLDIARHGLLDLELTGGRIRPAQLAQPPVLELEDLEHVYEVDAGRDRDQPERSHQQRPAQAVVAVVVGV